MSIRKRIKETDEQFNHRLAQIIRAYWRARGKTVTTTIVRDIEYGREEALWCVRSDLGVKS